MQISEILADGSIVLSAFNGSMILISVDTNGIKKPNRGGHDIFMFRVDAKDRLVPFKGDPLQSDGDLQNNDGSWDAMSIIAKPCGKNNTAPPNGSGCSWYARNNVNPDDSTKTYWDNLP